MFLGFPCGSAGNESACNAGDLDLIPGLGRSPGEGNSYPLQYSSLACFKDCISMGSQRYDWVAFTHTVKGFSVVNDTKLMFFGILLLFIIIQQMLAMWSLVPLPFWNRVCTSGSSWFTYCWSLAWKILSITLLACEMSTIVQYFEDSLALSFLESPF